MGLDLTDLGLTADDQTTTTGLNMAANPRGGGIADDLKDIKRRLRNLEKATRLPSASIGSGGLTIRDSGRLTVENGGDLILRDDDGTILWSAIADPIKHAWGYASDDPGFGSPGTWVEYSNEAFLRKTIPQGFEHTSMMIMVSAGDTFTGEGNLSVAPYLKFWFDDGTDIEFAIADGNNSGSGVVGVAYDFVAFGFNRDGTGFGSESLFPPGKRAVEFQVFASVALGGGSTEASHPEAPDHHHGNWHIATQVIYRRGAA